MPEDKIEIRSQEVQEILGKPPKWIIRWGISLTFFVVLIIFTGSYFFKYPDIIYSEITITTQNPPVYMVANISGRIEQLFVHDTQMVNANQVLAIIENPGDYKDIMFVEKLLDSLYLPIRQADTTIIPVFSRSFALGEIQAHFTSFIKSYIDYRTFSELQYYAKKITSVEEQIKMSNLYYDRLYRQRNILEREFELSSKKHDRAKKLFENEVIPEAEMEFVENDYLSKQFEFEGARLSLANTQIEIQNLQQTLLELKLKKSEETKTRQLELSGSYENLLAQIAYWKKQYLIISPISGQVSFLQYWKKNQNVQSGDKVIAVIPAGESEIIGKLNLNVSGSGKVETGQNVNIKLAGYPYMEYGIIRGIVRSVSLVPDKNAYLVEINLPEGLLTNYGTKLEFTQEMKGSAEIITEDISLYQRILNPIKSSYNKNFK